MNIKHLLKRTANNVELGIKIERARIIAILEHDVQYPPRRPDGDSGWIEIKLDDLIELINENDYAS
jgi:hypothetical protein